MNKSICALALALSVLPITALAQDTNPAPPTAAQRQQMHQIKEQYEPQMEQMHQQLRAEVLQTLTPVQRRAVAAEIGNLVISPNPDVEGTVKRIDSILPPGVQQRIVSAHQRFAAQMMQVHQQMMTQMQSIMPVHPMDEHKPDRDMSQMRDAGWILLHVLPPHDDMDHHMMPPGGPPTH